MTRLDDMNGMRIDTSSPRRTHRTRRLAGTFCVVGLLSIGATACGSDAVEQGTKTPPESTIGQLGVTGQWARATIADTKNSAAYFTIVSAVDDTLTKVSVDPAVAARAEMHETMMMPTDTSMSTDTAMGTDTTMSSGGEMQMSPVESIAVKGGTPTVLEPGGFHVMLFDLAKPLTEGDTITLTLTFTTHGDVAIEVPVLTEAP